MEWETSGEWRPGRFIRTTTDKIKVIGLVVRPIRLPMHSLIVNTLGCWLREWLPIGFYMCGVYLMTYTEN